MSFSSLVNIDEFPHRSFRAVRIYCKNEQYARVGFTAIQAQAIPCGFSTIRFGLINKFACGIGDFHFGVAG